jgi:hypothetical protein
LWVLSINPRALWVITANPLAAVEVKIYEFLSASLWVLSINPRALWVITANPPVVVGAVDKPSGVVGEHGKPSSAVVQRITATCPLAVVQGTSTRSTKRTWSRLSPLRPQWSSGGTGSERLHGRAACGSRLLGPPL